MSEIDIKTRSTQQAAAASADPSAPAAEAAPAERVEHPNPGEAEDTVPEGVAEASVSEAEPTVEDVCAERDKVKDQLLRTAADFENFRKRTRKDIELAVRRAREDIVRELLPVIDNLERAASAAGGAADLEGVREGVTMVLKQFEDVAERIQLRRLTPVGERFDPNLHDAIQQKETDEHEPGKVIAEVLAGYQLGEKLVRAAMVVVARKPTAASAESTEN